MGGEELCATLFGGPDDVWFTTIQLLFHWILCKIASPSVLISSLGGGTSSKSFASSITISTYVTRILVRVSDTIRIGYADTHFPKKH